MTSENTFALLIGVSHYPQWQGAGLRGAVNDARAWRALCLETLGVPPENVRLLCSPMEGPAAGEEAATEAQLRAGVAWLGDQMAAATATGAAPSGLIVFCGHGAALPDAGEGPLGIGVGLCAADLRRTEAGEVAGVFPVEALQATLAERCRAGGQDPDLSWPRDVTVVLDCCYSAVPGLTLAEPVQDSPRPERSQNLCRYLLACDPWSVSYELQSLGRWHGAFSYTLLTLLEQWTTRAEGGTAWFDVSAQTLIQRSAAMLEQLGLQQQPTLAGAPRVGMVPFLRPGLTVGPNLCAPFPNRRRPKAQIDSGWTGFRAFQVSVQLDASSDFRTVAYVVIPGSGCTAPNNNLHWGWEYWYPVPINPPQSPIEGISQIKFVAQAVDMAWANPGGDTGSAFVSWLNTNSLGAVPAIPLSGWGPFLPVTPTAPSGGCAHTPPCFLSATDSSPAAGVQLGFSSLQNGSVQLSWLAWQSPLQGTTRLLGSVSGGVTTFLFSANNPPISNPNYWSADLNSVSAPTSVAVSQITSSTDRGGFLAGQSVSYFGAWVDNNCNEGRAGYLSNFQSTAPASGSPGNLAVVGYSVPIPAPPTNISMIRLYRRASVTETNQQLGTTWLGTIPVSSSGATFIDD